MRNNGERKLGRVKWFDEEKGFGFVVNDNDEDVFVHYKAIPGRPGEKNLQEGDVVEYYEGKRSRGKYVVSIVEVRRS